MSVFLTPDLKPIFGGTYFPANDRYGMPSFRNLLNNVSTAWNDKRDRVIQEVRLNFGKLPDLQLLVQGYG